MTTKTIAQFARQHGLAVDDVSRAARDVLGLTSRRARDRDHDLKTSDCARLERHFGLRRPAAEPEPPPVPPAVIDRPLDPPADLPIGTASVNRKALRHPLFVHPDVFAAAARARRFNRRLSLVLQHLGAHGRTPTTKSCRDPQNRGWLRTPFGGNGGSHFYLWWSPGSSAPAAGLSVDSKAVVVQALRHHDDHRPLFVDELDEYLPLQPMELEDETLVERPWTAEQLGFIDSTSPVRLVHGRPGSGKTTVLWKAIETRADTRVLYVTWSTALADVAGERLASFAPVDTAVMTYDHRTFLGELTGADVPRATLAESRMLFAAEMSTLAQDDRRYWPDVDALHAEIRARLLGRAVPGLEGTEVEHDVARLTDDAYLDGRSDTIGRPVTRAVLRAYRALGDATTRAFPELVAATRAIARLRVDRLPPGFAEIDRIVIDEAQDLTLLDVAVFVELCRAIHRATGRAPRLLVAADEGQTVRPSGFEWSAVSRLIARRVARPERFQLGENLRSPAPIAEVVARVASLYRRLERRQRPSRQGGCVGAEHQNAQLVHVDARHPADAIDLLEQLDEIDGCVVIAPEHAPPPWVPRHLRDLVLAPAEAKGLEYQTVVVLDPGRAAEAITAYDERHGDTRFEHDLRTRIDQLRVAMSRATETLVFVDVQASAGQLAVSHRLLGEPAPFDPSDLVDLLSDPDAMPEDRVRLRIEDARAMIDDRPRRAWRRSVQAVRLLGDPALPNGVREVQTRWEAQRNLLVMAARLLVSGLPERIDRARVVAAARSVVDDLDSRRDQAALSALDAWSRGEPGSLFALLRGADALEDDWLAEATRAGAQRMRSGLEAAAYDPALAVELAGDVSGWLRRSGYAGDLGERTDGLRQAAFDTLLEADDAEACETLVVHLPAADHARRARLHRRQGHHREAAEHFERAGLRTDAVSAWRAAGDWSRALALAPPDSGEFADLSWLAELQGQVDARPIGHHERMTTAERKAFGVLVRRLMGGQSRR